MKYSLKLLESNSSIRKMILEALQEDVSQTINRAIPLISKQIQDLVRSAIRSSNEYQSLLSGKLRFEFGIPDTSVVDQVIDAWVNNINVDIKKISITNTGLSGGFSVGMIASDFQDVLSLAGSQVTDTEKGYSLPWLQWLLLDGNKVLVKDYKVVLGPNPYSRTGYALMRENSSSGWRVPAEFAGTVSNNWVTRAIDSLSDDINNIFIQEIEKAII
jgi:hypothetical protein